MKSPHRYLTFSLRTLFILLTASAVWLGVLVNRAREQREAVDAIEALGGNVFYDWSPKLPLSSSSMEDPLNKRRRTKWLRKAVGDDFFRNAEVVSLVFVPFDSDWKNPKKLKTLLPHLQRLRELKVVHISTFESKDTRERLAVALPACDIAPTALP